MRTYVLMGMAMLAGLCPAGAQTIAPATATAPKGDAALAVLAGQSLLASAMEGEYNVRTLALAKMAQQYAPDDAATQRLLGNLYELVGKGSQADRSVQSQLAAQAWAGYLKSHGDDYVAWMRWVAAGLAAQQSVETRGALLQRVINDAAIPAAVRSEAALQEAALLAGQGYPDDAERATLTSIRIDGNNVTALEQWLKRRTKASVLDRVDVRLRQFRGNPFSATTAAQLAGILGEQGLYEQSLRFYWVSWNDVAGLCRRKAPPLPLAMLYCNALLDAGQYKTAIETFVPLLEAYPGSIDLRMLMIEAHTLAGQAQEAQAEAAALRSQLGTLLASSPSPEVLEKVAVFYTVAIPDETMAVSLAQRALARDPRNVNLQRIVMAAELKSSNPATVKSAMEFLTALAKQNVYAAVVLAEHYSRIGAAEPQRQMIAKGLMLARTGPAARTLRAMAQKISMPVPPVSGSGEIAKLMETFDGRYIEMATAPQKFLAVRLASPTQSVRPGEPIYIGATLTNISSIPVPLGGWGAPSPVGTMIPAMGLTVTLAGGTRGSVLFSAAQMPTLKWPCPHQLEPLKSVAWRVRLDVGALGRELFQNCFDNLTITCSGIVDPQLCDGQIASGLAAIAVEPVTITRQPLGVLKGDGVFYDIARVLKGNAQPTAPAATRFRAADQVASMMASLGGQGQPPAAAAAADMMAVVKMLLADPEPVVRAEMLVQLARLPRRDDVVQMARQLKDDPSPLVRLRVAELAGPADPKLALAMSRDADVQVSLMAQAALPPAATQLATQPLPATAPTTAAPVAPAPTSEAPPQLPAAPQTVPAKPLTAPIIELRDY
ncbi:MAG: tetratricopeptide repeat protein [Planctomycetaceae bacterium]|nr:tetratricopeptide repeat protein [Planctomycetaceae bacterium]